MPTSRCLTVVAGMLFVFATGCTNIHESTCGDGRCEGGENRDNCLQDCQHLPFCGDGACNGTESCGSCQVDCGWCDSGFVPVDSGRVCGHGHCDFGESCATCSADCGPCDSGVVPADSGAWGCGDFRCNLGETCSTCPQDCGPCPPGCGDGTCGGGETCMTCPTDCGRCAPRCGDGTCNGAETCTTCPTDCGACGARCGDGTCNGTETCTSCPADCGACACSLGEGVACNPVAVAPSCCAGGRVCVNNGIQNACAVVDGLPCTLDSGCVAGSTCVSGVCGSAACRDPNLRVGVACATNTNCCALGDSGGRRSICITGNPGLGSGSICSAVCLSNANCNSGCCVGTISGDAGTGVSVCVHPALCITSRPGNLGIGSPCSDTTQCANVGTRFTFCDPSLLSTSGTLGACALLCTHSSDCGSGCCALSAGGSWRCVNGTSGCASP